MKKGFVCFVAVLSLLFCSGCFLMESLGLAAPEGTVEYDAAVFEQDMLTQVQEKKTEITRCFFSDSGMDEAELERCIDRLLNDSPEGNYYLAEVTYTFTEHTAYDEVEFQFSYREEALSPQEIVPAGGMLTAAEAVIEALENGETEMALSSQEGFRWESKTVEDLVSIAASNAVTAAEFRDFAYSCYGGEEGIFHLSVGLPLEEASYRALDAELQATLSAAAETFLAQSSDPGELYRAAHDYVVACAEYDDALAERSVSGAAFTEEDLIGRSAYGALIRGETVCSGYARAFQGLCRAMELPCWTLYGFVDADTPEEGEHVWNMVLLDGEAYYVDCTFDDGLGSDEYFFFTAADPQYDEYRVYDGWVMPW